MMNTALQARSGALAEDAVSTLRSLMQCNYTGLGRYLQYGRTHQWLFQHNKPLWPHCVADGESASKYRNSYCWDPAFLNTFCPSVGLAGAPSSPPGVCG